MNETAHMQAISAMQSAMLPPTRSAIVSVGDGTSDTGGTIGAVIGGTAGFLLGGGPFGAGIGAFAGKWLGERVGVIGELFDDGPLTLRDPKGRADWEQRRLAAAEEAAIARAKRSIGFLEIDPAAGARFLKTDLRGARLDLDAVGSPIASNRVAGMMFAMGLSNVEAGPGTVRISGGYFSAPAMQELAKGKLWSAPVTAKDMEATMALAHSVGYGSALDQKLFEEYSLQVRMNWQTVLHGATPKEFGGQAIGVVNAGENLVGSVRRLISAAHGDKSVMSKRAELLAILDKPGGVNHPQIRAALEQITGAKFESLAGAFEAGRGGAAAMGAAELADLSDEAAWLYKTFSPARPRVAAIAPPSTGSPVWPEFVAR